MNKTQLSTSEKLRIMRAFDYYPVQIDNRYEKSKQRAQKIAVVAHIAQLTGGFNALDVIDILKEVYNIRGELNCGSLEEACRILHLRASSLTDYGTVQFMFENQIQIQNFNKLLSSYL